MEDLSLHILDIVENAVNAGATRIAISIREDVDHDLLAMEIIDNGRGMDKQAVAKATDPFFTTRTTRRVGLGLPLLNEAARAANGTMSISSEVGKGTRIRATFQLGHIDRRPLGSIVETIVTLIAGWPEIDLTYRHERDGLTVAFTTDKIRSQLNGLPLNSAESLHFIREYLTQEETSLVQHDQE